MARVSSFVSPTVLVDRNIDKSTYDNIKKLAEIKSSIVTNAENIQSIIDAKQYADNASASASGASISETNAKTSEDNAKMSEINAKISEDKAQEYKELSFGSAYQAELSNQDALEARDKAKKWANEAENIEVESGLFSAYHWSQRAKAIANGSADCISVIDVVNESGDIIVKDNVQVSLANISAIIDEQASVLGNEIWTNAQNIQRLATFDIAGENLNIGGSTDSEDFVNIINKNYSGKPNGKYIINFHMAIRSDRGSGWNLLIPQTVCNGVELDGNVYIGNTSKFSGFYSTSIYGNFDSNGNLEFKVNIKSYLGQTIWWGKANQTDPAKGVNINLIKEV